MRGPDVRGLAWGDYDRDGDVDLYASTASDAGLLFRNDAGRTFTDVTASAGVAMSDATGRQPNWIDYDNDGDLDLHVTQRFAANRLYRNDRGRFVDVSAAARIGDPRRSVGACWFDFDHDGDLDVFVANQQGDRDGFFRNDKGVFIDIAAQLRMDQPHRTAEEGGVGCAVGDYDNDGDFDLYVSTYGAHLLYRNEGRGAFREVAAASGMSGSKHAVGAAAGDYDHDGRLDIYVAAYVQRGDVFQPTDHLFHNEGDRFKDMLGSGSALHGADHGVSWADYDNDGDLDISLTQGYVKNGRHPLLRNELAKQQRERSLQVLVLDRDGHATRAGAEVRLYDKNNALLGSRLVTTGDGYDSQSAAPVHFGLQQVAPVTVEITFMSRAGRQVQRVPNVDPRQWLGKWLVVKEAAPSTQ